MRCISLLGKHTCTVCCVSAKAERDHKYGRHNMMLRFTSWVNLTQLITFSSKISENCFQVIFTHYCGPELALINQEKDLGFLAEGSIK